MHRMSLRASGVMRIAATILVVSLTGAWAQDNPTTFPEKHPELAKYLQAHAETRCRITPEPPGKHEFKAQYGEGKLSVVDGKMVITGKLVYVDDPKLDNKVIADFADSKVVLHMEKPGDQVVQEKGKYMIGIGSSLRFDQQEWVPFFGRFYRKGSVAITKEGLLFQRGTETKLGKQILIYDGISWVAK